MYEVQDAFFRDAFIRENRALFLLSMYVHDSVYAMQAFMS